MALIRMIFLLIALLVANANLAFSTPTEPACESSYCSLCQRSYCDSIFDNATFTSEILWFKVCEDGIPFGTQVDEKTLAPVTEIHSRVKNLHSKWSEGFRLGLTHLDPCEEWITAVFWTHFNNHIHHTHTNTAVTAGDRLSFFVPAFGSTAFNSSTQYNIDSTFARWKLNVDYVDLEIGKAFCPIPCLSFHPFLGLRALWLRQSYNIVNSSLLALVNRGESDVQSVRLKSHYEGLGLRMGLNSYLDVCYNLGLYAKAAATVLYGNFKIKSEDYLIIGNDSGSPSQIEQKDDFCACSFSTDLGIGILWKGCLCEYPITVNLGWEQHLFLNHNHFEDFVQILPTTISNNGQVKNPQIIRGDLCLQGFVFGANLDF